MHFLAAEDGFFAFEVFFEEAVNKLVGLGIEEVQMVHSVFLRADFGLIVREGERMGWHIDFGDDFNTVFFRQFLEVDKFGL